MQADCSTTICVKASRTSHTATTVAIPWRTPKQLNPNNHANRKQLSTMTLLEITDEKYQGNEKQKMTSLMTVDQSATFECVDFKILLQKLDKYHVGQSALKWIKYFLEYRNQYVVIGRGCSRMVWQERGVPNKFKYSPCVQGLYTKVRYV